MHNKIYVVPPFKHDVQTEELKLLISNLFVESAKYTSSKIENKNSKTQFEKTCKRIQETFYYGFYSGTPFKKSKAFLIILENSIRYAREIESSLFDFIEPKKVYDDTAFNIMYDILSKIETRFLTGYGQN